jgi:hypothetical protein
MNKSHFSKHLIIKKYELDLLKEILKVQCLLGAFLT